ncbi:MAG: hypothetical protein ACRDRL_16875, partial [Sciscionella sp.]
CNRTFYRKCGYTGLWTVAERLAERLGARRGADRARLRGADRARLRGAHRVKPSRTVTLTGVEYFFITLLVLMTIAIIAFSVLVIHRLFSDQRR